MSSFEVMNPFEHHWAVVIECHTLLQAHEIPEELIVKRKGITGATQYVAGDVSPSLLETRPSFKRPGG